MKQLQQLLKRIDGKGYKAYKSIQGSYQFQQYKIAIDYVQGDPFASPSKIRILIPDKSRAIHPEWKKTRERDIYTRDRIARSVAAAIRKESMQSKGSGKSGLVAIDNPGQEIIERTAVQLEEGKTIICLSIGLPANGRRINGREAEKLFFSIIPSILQHSIFAIKDEEIEESIQLADQHVAIRRAMKQNDWIAFVADGAILPRDSGVSNRPMKKAVPFKSPEENRVEIDVPYRDQPLTGMAIKKGITLIVGGGYHGKSTLLQALERGVYTHIRGDGREYVLTDPHAVKIRAEDGRQVTAVNISDFINDLPHGQDTNRFTTENASGSTSQAANVVEAIEAEASTLLIDEDTSATNFMIRDARMQALVSKDKEPITPFIDKITQLRDDIGVSTILVMGGSGDYFDVADNIIMMDQYLPYNVTEKAQEIVNQHPVKRQGTPKAFQREANRRIFLANSLALQRGKKKKVQAKGLSTIVMGRSDIQLDAVEQLADASQTRTIAEIIRYLDAKGILKKEITLPDLLQELENIMDQEGLQAFAPFSDQHPGDLARPRRFEIAACLNRMRTAKIK